MQLINEEHNVLCLSDLLENIFQPVFKVAAVLCPGEHPGKVERDNTFVAQVFRHLAVRHTLGKSFGHGSLADARLADENRIVF